MKKSYPNRWTDSASGHVDDGETYDVAVTREMKEEIGLEVDLTFVGKFPTQDKLGTNTLCEFNAVYEGRLDSSHVFELQDDEVSEVKWFALDELKALIVQNPDDFVLGFREAIKRYY